MVAAVVLPLGTDALFEDPKVPGLPLISKPPGLGISQLRRLLADADRLLRRVGHLHLDVDDARAFHIGVDRGGEILRQRGEDRLLRLVSFVGSLGAGVFFAFSNAVLIALCNVVGSSAIICPALI